MPPLSEHSELPIKSAAIGDDGAAVTVSTASPKAAQIEAQKEKFIVFLWENGGNVTQALRSSGLLRNTAYSHLQSDKLFADKWSEAIEAGYDELYSEARRRAVDGAEKIHYKTGQVFKEKSDILLIFLLKQKEAHKKWRNRLIETGNIALESVRVVGQKHGLTDTVIREMQLEMLDRFKAIQIV